MHHSVFELVSAYGGVGLSLGLPYVSFSAFISNMQF
jgi:Trk-type K+ transport system membrane component